MSNSAKASDDSTPAPDGELSSEPTPASGSGLLEELLSQQPEQAESTSPERAPASGPRMRVGKLIEWSSGQAPRVEFEGNELGPLPARSTIPLDPSIILAAIQDERGVLLCFEDGKPHAPIITGLLQPLVDFEAPPELWQDQEDDAEASPDAPDMSEVEARVDGRRVELEAADEIVLRCGQASIVLRRNGRVVIRGTYVETRSRGVNRIKGGSVEIN